MPDQQTSNLKRLALLAMAFSLLTTTTLLMNVRLFPLIDGGLPFFRESCALVYALVLIVMGVLCARTRMDRVSRVFDVAAFAFPVLAVVVMLAGYIFGSVVVLELGAFIGCMGRAVILMYVGVSISVMPHFDMVVAVAIGYLVQRIAFLGFGFLSDFMVIFLFAFMPFLSLALALNTGREYFSQIRIAHSASELSATNPFSFVPLKSLFMLSLFVYQLAFGFSVRLGEGAGAVVYEAWIVAPLAIMVALAAFKARRPNADDFNDIAVLVVICAFLVILVNPYGDYAVASSMLSAGSTIFNVVTWVALLGLISNNRIAGPAVIGFGRGVCALGSIAGAQVGALTNELILVNPVLVTYVAAAMIFIFVVFAFLVMRRFSFSETAAGLVPMTLPVEHEDSPVASGAPQASEPAVNVDVASLGLEPVQVGAQAGGHASSDAPAGAGSTGIHADANSASRQDATDEPQSEARKQDDLRRGFDERCFALAGSYGLTEREKEVFLLLARGRNRDYIQEALVISKNTVKVHVKHIYQKMEVHSHQELIDMVVSTL